MCSNNLTSTLAGNIKISNEILLMETDEDQRFAYIRLVW